MEFIGKPVKVGGARGVTIPKKFFDTGLVSSHKIYRVVLEEMPPVSSMNESEGISTVSYAFALPWVVA